MDPASRLAIRFLIKAIAGLEASGVEDVPTKLLERVHHQALELAVLVSDELDTRRGT